ncbi:MAG: YafY family transcriptional regulator [Rhizobiales bacterium]|nr:YafY family transcriptional regulator [Hyphomicrobiales bacterium]
MRRADRLLRIIQILRRHRRPVRGQSMSEELEVSLRTLYRDIADLVADGVPIRGEAGIGYVLGQGYDLPPLMFTTDEVEAVMLGLRWVMRRGDPDLVRAAQDAVAKVATVLPEELRPVFSDASLIVPPSWRMIEDTVDVAPLRRAIREQRKVRISYSNESGIASERVIWPFAISYFDAQRLIVSWCELRGAFRTFRTDRMVEAEVLADKYRERRAVLLKRWSEEQGVSAE